MTVLIDPRGTARALYSEVLDLTALGAWIVPIMFVHLPTSALAGGMAAKLLTAQTWVTLVCGLCLLVSFRSNQPLAPVAPTSPAILLIVSGMLLALLVEFAVAPRIALRENLRLWHNFAAVVVRYRHSLGLERAAGPRSGLTALFDADLFAWLGAFDLAASGQALVAQNAQGLHLRPLARLLAVFKHLDIARSGHPVFIDGLVSGRHGPPKHQQLPNVLDRCSAELSG